MLARLRHACKLIPFGSPIIHLHGNWLHRLQMMFAVIVAAYRTAIGALGCCYPAMSTPAVKEAERGYATRSSLADVVPDIAKPLRERVGCSIIGHQRAFPVILVFRSIIVTRRERNFEALSNKAPPISIPAATSLCVLIPGLEGIGEHALTERALTRMALCLLLLRHRNIESAALLQELKIAFLVRVDV